MENKSGAALDSLPVRFGDSPKVGFGYGVVTSFLFHVVFGIIVVIVLEHNAENAIGTNQVFSVTIEGGVNLGGISQAPKPGAKKILTPEQNQDEKSVEKTPEKTTEKTTPPETVKEKTPEKSVPPPEEKPQKELTQPSAVEDPAKALQEKKLLEEKERKVQEEKKKEEQQKKQKEVEEKEKEKEKKRKEDEKRQEEKEKQAREHEREERNKKLDEALKRVQNQYEGESANAGGKGFGAGSLGGKGMGGGTITSIEKYAYQNELQRYVKSGWHWLGGSEHLVAKVRVKILQNGQLQDARIEVSSGNRNFDDSVVRAVAKASPVPPPPPGIYEDFKDVTFTFDSKESTGG